MAGERKSDPARFIDSPPNVAQRIIRLQYLRFQPLCVEQDFLAPALLRHLILGYRVQVVYFLPYAHPVHPLVLGWS